LYEAILKRTLIAVLVLAMIVGCIKSRKTKVLTTCQSMVRFRQAFGGQSIGFLGIRCLNRLCIASALAITLVVAAIASERPILLDFTLPYPQKIPELIAPEKLPYFRIERLVPLLLEIDKQGRVKSVTAEDSSESPFADYAEAWLKSIPFEPATFKGKKTKSRLPVLFQFRPQVSLPEIHFPVDSNQLIADADLYFKAVSLNSICLPRLEEFPSYFCDLKWSDSLVSYKYVLVKVELDKSGKVVNTEPAHSTFPAYTMPTTSAILWANFVPAAVQGKPVPAECYVLVSFFPYINYPTRVWRQTELDSLSLLEKFRVRLLPDTVGLMSKPLPAWAGGEEFTYSGLHQFLRDTVSAMLYIDTSGHVRLGRMSNGSKQLQAIIREITPHLRFFPALDYQGQCRPYSGLTSFVFQGSAKIRIVCHWLWGINSVTQN
jgi:hypothetical protein